MMTPPGLEEIVFRFMFDICLQALPTLADKQTIRGAAGFRSKARCVTRDSNSIYHHSCFV